MQRLVHGGHLACSCVQPCNTATPHPHAATCLSNFTHRNVQLETERNVAHQNLDFAETSLVAHSFMRYRGGSGSASVGVWRPTTWYWWRLKAPCSVKSAEAHDAQPRRRTWAGWGLPSPAACVAPLKPCQSSRHPPAAADTGSAAAHKARQLWECLALVETTGARSLPSDAVLTAASPNNAPLRCQQPSFRARLGLLAIHSSAVLCAHRQLTASGSTPLDWHEARSSFGCTGLSANAATPCSNCLLHRRLSGACSSHLRAATPPRRASAGTHHDLGRHLDARLSPAICKARPKESSTQARRRASAAHWIRV